jgi:hypothetical protein
MKSDWLIVLVSVGIALALVGPVLWHYREETLRGWRKVFEVDRDDDRGRVMGRESIRDGEPLGWLTVLALAAIGIAIPCVLGVAVSYGGPVAWSVCAAFIFVLVILFNVVLFAHLP